MWWPWQVLCDLDFQGLKSPLMLTGVYVCQILKHPYLTFCRASSFLFFVSFSKRVYCKLIYTIIVTTRPAAYHHLFSLLCAYKRDGHCNLNKQATFKFKGALTSKGFWSKGSMASSLHLLVLLSGAFLAFFFICDSSPRFLFRSLHSFTAHIEKITAREFAFSIKWSCFLTPVSA